MISILQRFKLKSTTTQLALAGLSAEIAAGLFAVLGVLLGFPFLANTHTRSLLSLNFMVFLSLIVLPPFIKLFTGYAMLKLYRYKLPFTASFGGVALTFIVSFVFPPYTSNVSTSTIKIGTIVAEDALSHSIYAIISMACFLLIGWLLNKQTSKAKLILWSIRIVSAILFTIFALGSLALAIMTFYPFIHALQ